MADGPVDQALRIARDLAAGLHDPMSARRLVVAELLALSTAHHNSDPTGPDPYSLYTRRLLADGRITTDDVQTAVLAVTLDEAVRHGYLPADLYDRAVAFAHRDPVATALLTLIERH